MPRELAMKRGIPIPFSPSFSKDYLDQLACDLIVSQDGMFESFIVFCLSLLYMFVLIVPLQNLRILYGTWLQDGACIWSL